MLILNPIMGDKRPVFKPHSKRERERIWGFRVFFFLDADLMFYALCSNNPSRYLYIQRLRLCLQYGLEHMRFYLFFFLTPEGIPLFPKSITFFYSN